MMRHSSLLRSKSKTLTTVLTLLSALLLLPAGTAMAKDKSEHLGFKLGAEWKPAYSSDKHRSTILEFIREGDDINNWKELVTYQNFGRDGKESAADTLNELKAIREKECPGATVWNVIDKDESRILYEWRIRARKAHSNALCEAKSHLNPTSSNSLLSGGHVTVVIKTFALMTRSLFYQALGGEVLNGCRLPEIATTVASADAAITRRVRRIMVQSYS